MCRFEQTVIIIMFVSKVETNKENETLLPVKLFDIYIVLP